MTDNDAPEPQTVITSLRGHLLCAVPQLVDPNFVRAVVLMVAHDEDGAFGLVINDALPTLVAEVTAAIDVTWAGPEGAQLRLGGPVEPTRGFILHGDPTWDPLAEPLVDDLCLTTSLDAIERDRPLGADGSAMVILGYAGWGAGQLEAEMNSGSWIAAPILGEAERGRGVRPRWLFAVEPAQMWSEALAAAGIDPARFVGHSGLGAPIAKA
ncbi:MAG: YqgE/AlgH family protein [Nannocystis sp.]|nr:YqgE/AlgH family protein [Nannocystis sp.]